MPVTYPKAEGIAVGSGTNDNPRGIRSQHFYEELGYGVPRFDDLLTVRELERRHSVQIPMEAVIKQVTTTQFNLKPTVDDPTDIHWEAAEAITEFLDGGYNPNGDSFDHLLKMWVRDILSINAGVLELVPTKSDENGVRWLAEIYARDGSTFTKNPDEHGRLPEPPAEAYYQYGHNNLQRRFDRDQAIAELLNETGWAARFLRRHKPIGFTRDELVWVEENPTTWNTYGMGRVQMIQHLVELILNQDLTNMKQFTASEVPEGMLSLINANEEKVKRFREDWQEHIAGKKHKMAIVGGELDWTPFRATAEELQFLESQQWYHKLVWMAFGVGPNEVGHIEDVNRATAREQSTTIFRKTTKPLLELLENIINTQILPKMREYWVVDGELTFEWEIYNEAVEDRERAQQTEDLQNNVVTINEVRHERGQEEVEWGDMPLEVYRAMARTHPEWFAEELGYEDVPEPVGGGLFNSHDPDDDAGGIPASSRDHGGDRFDFRSEVGKAAPDLAETEHPDLSGEIEGLKRGVGRVFQGLYDDLEGDLERLFPEEAQKAPVNLDVIIDNVDIAGLLTNLAIAANGDAMAKAADHEAKKVEAQIRERLDADDADVERISIDYDVEDSFTYEAMRQRTRGQMGDVETHVKGMLRNALDGARTVQEAKEHLLEATDRMADGHAETIARTELLGASRRGSQALAESSDLIDGKRWNATPGSRTRPWHAAMDGEVVGKNQSFVVPEVNDPHQPGDYPREAEVVGEDQPFNCRCSQSAVLAENLPKDALDLDAINGVSVELAITNRQYEIWKEWHEPGEAFLDTWTRLNNEMSKSEMGREVCSTATVYKWNEKWGIR